MTRIEANAALCRALGVEPLPLVCDCYDMELACACEPIYPDLTSADALTAALHHCHIKFNCMQSCSIVWRGDNGRFEAYEGYRETHGSMLFRAACAAFGIEMEREAVHREQQES